MRKLAQKIGKLFLPRTKCGHSVHHQGSRRLLVRGMHDPVGMHLPPQNSGLFLSRDAERLGQDPRRMSALVVSGELVRVRRGAYVSSAAYESASPRMKHVMMLRATALAADDPPVFSHVSAAAIWGLPILGVWPAEAHIVCGVSTGGRSSRGIVRHGVAMDLVDVRLVNGLFVTSLERTLIDLAATTSFASAVISMDHALGDDLGRVEPMTTKELISRELNRLDLRRGRARVELVLSFAVTCSGSPGESLSRVRFHELGFPAPKLQVEFVHHTGVTDRCDFDWEEFGLIGEFDGHGKYLNPRLRAGLSADQVVIREKQREDRLRTRRPHFSRWEWRDALEPPRLLAILVAADLPRTGIRTLPRA